MTISCLAAIVLTPDYSIARSKKNSINKKATVTDFYQDAPQLFQAEYGIIGKYWSANKNRAAKVYIGDDEYIDVVVIKKNNLNTKKSKELRKHKEYLGFYLSPKTNFEYNLYGVNKNPDPVDDGPDADVLTVIAIKQDFGIDE